MTGNEFGNYAVEVLRDHAKWLDKKADLCESFVDLEILAVWRECAKALRAVANQLAADMFGQGL